MQDDSSAGGPDPSFRLGRSIIALCAVLAVIGLISYLAHFRREAAHSGAVTARPGAVTKTTP
jgi:hypothetical protein